MHKHRPENVTTPLASYPPETSKLHSLAFALALVGMGSAGQALAAETISTLEQQTGVAVTIYNENLALVKDSRSVTIPTGEQTLALRGVSAMLRPETALLRNNNAKSPLVIREQNFDYDLLTPDKLLEKYLGKEVRIVTTNPATGVEKEQRATVLSTNGGTVVKIGNRIETNPPGRFIFDNVPDNLRDKPTLSVVLDNKTAQQQNLQLSYLTGGLAWRADYVAELSKDDDSVDLTGWVTLNNNSGTTYNNARMQLVAGDVNLVREQFSPRMRGKTVAMEMAQADSSMSEESLFEYHLYSLNRPTTIRNQQSKQVSLLTVADVPVKKELVLDGSNYYYRSSARQIGQKLKFGVYVQIENEKKNGLGLPLPKGIVRVYKRDSNNSIQFIGEDRIDHTPNKDKLRLKLGDAFDVVANKTQTSFKINERVLSRDEFDSSYAIEVTNGKTTAVDVVIREPIPGDWKILSESSPHKKVSSNLAEWRLRVPAEGKLTLTYATRVKP